MEKAYQQTFQGQQGYQGMEANPIESRQEQVHMQDVNLPKGSRSQRTLAQNSQSILARAGSKNSDKFILPSVSQTHVHNAPTERQGNSKFAKHYNKIQEKAKQHMDHLYREKPPNHLRSPSEQHIMMDALRAGTVDSEHTVKNIQPAQFFEVDPYVPREPRRSSHVEQPLFRKSQEKGLKRKISATKAEFQV